VTRTRDPRTLLWGLLGLIVAIELLYSSRWWPPRRWPAAPSPGAVGSPAPLRSLLEASIRSAAPRPLRVWFAPYTTFPETGMLESTVRSGVYDTLLSIPSSGIASNYGAFKLSPADTLFSLASAYGLASELRLARRLGYNAFALDLGAVTDSEAAYRLCLRSPGCRLSSDAYALFPIGGPFEPLERGLAALQRRTSLLPQKSAGVTWGPLVFPLLEWQLIEVRPGAISDAALAVQPLTLPTTRLFRYTLDHYPRAMRPLLRLSDRDVQLVLSADVIQAQLCIGPEGAPCRIVILTPGLRRLPIGDLLPPGRLSRIQIQSLLRQPGGQGLYLIELRAPAAARALRGAG